jgi:hypothetical protein
MIDSTPSGVRALGFSSAVNLSGPAGTTLVMVARVVVRIPFTP